MTARRESRRHSAPLTCRCPKWRLKSPPLRANNEPPLSSGRGGFPPPALRAVRGACPSSFFAPLRPRARGLRALRLSSALPGSSPPRGRYAGLCPGAAASCCLACRCCGSAASPALSGSPKAARQPRRGATRQRCLSVGVTCAVLPRASAPCAVPPLSAGPPPLAVR